MRELEVGARVAQQLRGKLLVEGGLVEKPWWNKLRPNPIEERIRLLTTCMLLKLTFRR
jgi:hypothetical protein